MKSRYYGEEEYIYEKIPIKSKTKKVDSADIFSTDDFVDYDKCKDLYGNPFLYYNTETNIYADSIEDFAVKYKNNCIYFGSFLRSSYIPKKDKIKYTKKYFKYWFKDFRNKYSEIVRNEKDLIHIIKDLNIDFFCPYIILFSIFSFIIGIFYLVLSLNVAAGNGLCDKIITDLSNIYSYNVYKIISIIYFISLFTVTALIVVIAIIYYKLKKKKIVIKRNISKSLKIISRTFRRAYPKTLRYYLKMIKKDRRFYSSIRIKDINCSKYNYEESSKYLEEIKKQTLNIQRFTNNIKVIIKGVLWAVFVMSIVYIGVIIYLLLKNL